MSQGAMDDGAASAFQVRIPRDVIEVAGPDAAAFLQGQLSQDVAGLAVGGGAYSLLLQPQGKVDAWLRVTRVAEDVFLLDVDGGWADAVCTRLNRFKLRTRCELTPRPDWTCWAVRGMSASTWAGSVLGAASGDGSGAVVVPVSWPTVEGFDRMGVGLGPIDGIAVVDLDRYETVRVEAGVPAMGHELDDSTIPAEGGQWLIDRSVSFTKGCYTGQELVARVDSRGSNTPRRLRLVRAGGGLSVGAVLELDGEAVGTVTSVAGGGAVGLAYLKRAVEVPATVRTPDADPVEVQALPVPSVG